MPKRPRPIAAGPIGPALELIDDLAAAAATGLLAGAIDAGHVAALLVAVELGTLGLRDVDRTG